MCIKRWKVLWQEFLRKWSKIVRRALASAENVLNAASFFFGLFEQFVCNAVCLESDEDVYLLNLLQGR